MPTADRRRFVAQSIRYFMAQDYPSKELIVVDDGADAVEDLMPADPRVRYVPIDRKTVLGAKRNLACRLAGGDLIAHWDDDDWHAPDRLRTQVAAMQTPHVDVSGCRSLLYYEPATDEAWRYEYPPGPPRWVAGNTLCYRRQAWERSPFPEIAIGEDSAFTRNRDPDRVAIIDGDLVVGIIHPSNTSPKQTAGLYWNRHHVQAVHALLGDDRHVLPGTHLPA
jgi:glycosyltransferase involved in cell wall biosynthesis